MERYWCICAIAKIVMIKINANIVILSVIKPMDNEGVIVVEMLTCSTNEWHVLVHPIYLKYFNAEYTWTMSLPEYTCDIYLYYLHYIVDNINGTYVHESNEIVISIVGKLTRNKTSHHNTMKNISFPSSTIIIITNIITQHNIPLKNEIIIFGFVESSSIDDSFNWI